MYTSDRDPHKELRSFRTFFGVTILVATSVVFFGLQIMMVGPLKNQLDTIQSRLDDTEKDMRKLVAERNQLWHTNDLLSGLQDQAKSVKQIEATLSSIKTLRQQVEHESRETQRAMTAFNSIASLHKRLAAQDKHTEMALGELSDLIELRQSLLESGKDTSKAMAALDDLSEVAAAAVTTASDVDEAEEAISKLSELKYRMLGESDGVKAAEEGVARIAALSNKLASQDLSAAEENANRLLVINDSLSATKTNAAGESLDNLLALQSRLTTRATDVAGAVQSLEILDDFEDEVDSHIRSIEGLRRTMVEIAMLESSVGRVARVLKPLVEISNLRRLGEREVREAARVILDQRHTRLSQNSSIVKSAPTPEVETVEAPNENLVPLPPAAVIENSAE